MKLMKYGIMLMLMTGVLAKAVLAQTPDDSIRVKEYRSLAKQKMAEGDYRYAANIYDMALQLDSTDLYMWLERARIEDNIEGSNEAIYFISRANLLDTLNPEPYNRASIFLSARGEIEGALALMDEAIMLADGDTTVAGYLSNRGAVHLQGNDMERAIKDFEDALALDASMNSVRNNLAASLGRVGRDQEAIVLFKELEKVTKDTFGRLGIAVNLGLCYADVDSLEKSLHYFDIALSLNPNEALAYSNRSSTLRKLGRLDAALESINKSIALYPSNAYAYVYLAEIYFDQGLKKEGCKALDYADSIGFRQQYGEKTQELRSLHCD